MGTVEVMVVVDVVIEDHDGGGGGGDGGRGDHDESCRDHGEADDGSETVLMVGSWQGLS